MEEEKNSLIYKILRLSFVYRTYQYLVIKNNYFRNLTINSKFNPISTKGGFIEKIILRIKGKMVRNKFDFRNN